MSSAANSVFRQAATTTVLQAVYRSYTNPTQLNADFSTLLNSSAVSCFIPPVTLMYNQAGGRGGILSYYGVNVSPNFVLLQYTQDNLNTEIGVWRGLVICAGVIIMVGFLLGVAVFLWWWFVLRESKDDLEIRLTDESEEEERRRGGANKRKQNNAEMNKSF